MVIKINMEYAEDRDALVKALSNNGYHTWVEICKCGIEDKRFVCFECADHEVETERKSFVDGDLLKKMLDEYMERKWDSLSDADRPRDIPLTLDDWKFHVAEELVDMIDKCVVGELDA